jgi:hypothetical protein
MLADLQNWIIVFIMNYINFARFKFIVLIKIVDHFNFIITLILYFAIQFRTIINFLNFNFIHQFISLFLTFPSWKIYWINMTL